MTDDASDETLRRHFELRSCTLKKRYKIEPPLPNMSMRAYPCEFCGGWHLARRQDRD